MHLHSIIFFSNFLSFYLENLYFRYIIEGMSDYLDPNNEELLKDFFAEAEQQVEQLESNILVIENDPSNHEAIDEIFRAAHTLKGGSATVEMMELSHFTHSVEDVLDEIRSDRVSIDEDVVDLLLTSIDVIKAMLEARQNGTVYEENIDGIIEKLKSYIPEKGSKPVPKKHRQKQLRLQFSRLLHLLLLLQIFRAFRCHLFQKMNMKNLSLPAKEVRHFGVLQLNLMKIIL